MGAQRHDGRGGQRAETKLVRVWCVVGPCGRGRALRPLARGRGPSWQCPALSSLARLTAPRNPDAFVRPQRVSSVQEFERPSGAVAEDASEDAKIRSKKMQKIGYKGDNAVEADEARPQRAPACL